jgi:hypothetical protein
LSFCEKISEVARKHGRDVGSAFLRESLAERRARLDDFSLRQFAERTMGHRWQEKLLRFNAGDRFQEASEAVDASNFVSISGQLLVDVVKDRYQQATFLGNELLATETITNGNLGAHVEPYLSNVINGPSVVQQGEPYPRSQFTPQTVTHPAPQKFGEICEVTMEMIWSDKTKQALDAAGSVGDLVGMYEEEQKLKVVYGVVNPYVFNGTALNTYLTAGAYVNDQTGFTLTDWESVNAMEQLLYQIVDPVTGKNIDIKPSGLLVLPARRHTAKRIMNATETRSGDITTGGGTQTIAASPLDANYPVLFSRHARRLLVAAGVAGGVADSYTILGDFKRAFVWRQVFPTTVVQLPPGNPAEFDRDIALQIKAHGYGVASVRDPRYVTRGRSA